MNFQVYKSLQELSQTAVDMFLSEINGPSISIVVPGGKTPRYFFQFLSQSLVDWKKVTIILSDERMVPVNHRASNYAMIKKILLDELDDDKQPQVLPEMEKFGSENFENIIRETNILLKEKTTVSQAFLGLGSDGHIASLFPGKNSPSERNKSPYLFNKLDGESFRRMSLSMAFIQQIPELTFLVSGKSKQKALESIIDSKISKLKSPALRLINNYSGRLNILCDQESYPQSVNA